MEEESTLQNVLNQKSKKLITAILKLNSFQSLHCTNLMVQAKRPKIQVNSPPTLMSPDK
jgi:hypothetical protein